MVLFTCCPIVLLSASMAITGSSWYLGKVWWHQGGPVATPVEGFLGRGWPVAAVIVELRPIVVVLFKLFMEFAGRKGFLEGAGIDAALKLLLLEFSSFSFFFFFMMDSKPPNLFAFSPLANCSPTWNIQIETVMMVLTMTHRRTQGQNL